MANATKEMFRERRLAAGMTQQSVADLMKVSLDSIKKWEAGLRPIRPSMWALFECLSRDKLAQGHQ
jgi:transcriptional regulator with XRE-family HTH domain